MSKPLNEYTKEELIEYIGSLKKQKKYGLVWEEKIEKVVEECQNKLPVVEEISERAIINAPSEPTNLIIEGDNYHALSVLNYTHAGKIDVIYIDPPYNTGNKDFIYDDNYVDSEDPFRHSKWLSFMDKRLRLAKSILSADGIIFISIDDNEQAVLRLMCDEIFGEQNFISCMIWQNKYTIANDKRDGLTTQTEYILVYSKGGNVRFNSLPLRDEYIKSTYSNPDNDPNGDYMTVQMFKYKNPKSFDVVSPSGKTWNKPWNFTPESFKKLDEAGCVYWGNDGNSLPRKKVYLKDSRGTGRRNLLLGADVGFTADSSKDMKDIFGDPSVFLYTKPKKLMKYLIGMIDIDNPVILDFFAGSGTTGQAVMELNQEDGRHRQFILVTNNDDKGNKIAEKVTYPRMRTVITGIRPDGLKYSDGISANLRYFKTSFVEKGLTTDDTREALVSECADMIRIRENAFDFVASTPEYRFYKNDKVFVPIIFDQFAIEETWKKVEELNTDKLPVHVYNFSYNRHANEEEIPDTDLEWTACSIPESVLEVYRRIFRKKEDKHAA
ncbi:MAG: site-specific DNA-methyltransferase [Clostridia bacterium]|nr:site-specific DNA-methyltransferase [Clostridia bacterium]